MGLVYLLWMVLAMSMESSNAGVKLDLHLALSQGSPLPKQEGDYLQDSFRHNVLILGFAELNLEIENLKTELDQLAVTLTILETANTVMFFLVGILLFITRNTNLKNENNIKKLNNAPAN